MLIDQIDIFLYTENIGVLLFETYLVYHRKNNKFANNSFR